MLPGGLGLNGTCRHICYSTQTLLRKENPCHSLKGKGTLNVVCEFPELSPSHAYCRCLGHSFNQQGNNGAHKQTGFEQQQQLTVQQSLSRMTFLLKTSWAYPQSIGAALGTHTQEQNSSPPMGTLICRLPAPESPTVRTEDTLYTA